MSDSQRQVIFIDKTDPYLREQLESMDFVCQDYAEKSREEILEVIDRFFGLIIRSRVRLDEAFLSRATNLRFIGRSGVGLEHIDLDCAAGRGIAVFPSAEGSRDTVGEHTVGLLLALMNNLARADRQVREGLWIREGNRGTEIRGKTIGIIGYGNMGTAFAQRLKGFGARVIAYDKFKTNYGDENAEAVDLATLQAEADIVSLHIPYLPENHHLVDDHYLNSFRKPIFLINTARGLVLHTADLVKNLRNGKVLGAALDVIEYEDQSFRHLDPDQMPAPFQFLRQAPNVVLTPHIAGWSFESEFGHAKALVDKIGGAFGG